jgi:uncharacterized protein
MSWIRTYTGRKFDLIRPEPEMVCIEDIAHSLAYSSRFNGHLKELYTIAQHSLYVAQLCASQGASATVQLQALLHDAPEAYIGDMVRPLKRLLRIFQMQEDTIHALISNVFNIPEDMPDVIHWADNTMLASEARQLFPAFDPTGWEALPDPVTWKITVLSPADAEEAFLLEFYRLKELAAVEPPPPPLPLEESPEDFYSGLTPEEALQKMVRTELGSVEKLDRESPTS